MGAKLGQHFLRDESLRDAVAETAAPRPDELVLEIGPGRGAITGRLLASGARVTAVEMDDALARTLPALVPDKSRLTVINEDFLRLDLATLGPGPWAVVGNLPYSVGGPILQKILAWEHWSRAVLMFQKEVALRVVAEPGGPDYGLLTLSVMLRAEGAFALEAPRAAFAPAPKVDSGVVILRRLAKPRLDKEDERSFWRLTKSAFSQRRKMAAGVIAATLGKPRAEVEAAFAAAGVPKDARPERVPFNAWLALAKTLCV